MATNYFQQHSVNLFSGERLLHYVRNDRGIGIMWNKKVVIARPQAAAISSLLRIIKSHEFFFTFNHSLPLTLNSKHNTANFFQEHYSR